MAQPCISESLRADLHVALVEYLSRAEADLSDARLAGLMNTAGSEAVEAGMPPEQMILALKEIFRGVDQTSVRDMERLKNAYHHFTGGTLKAYFRTE